VFAVVRGKLAMVVIATLSLRGVEMSFDPNDPKFQGFVKKMLHSTLMAAIHALLFRMSRIWLVGIVLVLLGVIMYFGYF
jgi:hypothetical protein